jgi:hypothetical protein
MKQPSEAEKTLTEASIELKLTEALIDKKTHLNFSLKAEKQKTNKTKSNQIFLCINLKNTPENRATVRELHYQQPKSQRKRPTFKIRSNFEF